MGLIMSFPNNCKSNNLQENAYIKANKNLNHLSKQGSVELQAWTSKEDKATGSRKICQISIPVSLAEERVGETGNIENLNYYDIEWITGEDFYTKIKSLQIAYKGSTIDMTVANNSI